MYVFEYADEHNFDLVIMGTRDQHGIFDKLLGSASSVAIRQAKCPVVLIHENTKYVTPEKIAFAIDDEGKLEESIEEYRKFNDVLKAKTDFIHIDQNEDDLNEQKEDIIDELIESKMAEFSFEIKSLKAKDIITTLKDYCVNERIDLVAMVHKKEGWFSGIFNTNHSVKMAQEFHLPTIIFQEK